MAGSVGGDEGFEAWLSRRQRERADASAVTVVTPRPRRRQTVPATDAGRDRRREAAEWAGETMRHERVVFLDTETTGFGPRAEIIDIGIVASDGTVLLDTLVRPESPIPASTSKVHGLFDHDVATAPAWTDVYPEVYQLLVGARVVVYNAPFDSGMVTSNCQRHRLVIPTAHWHCAMRQYSAFAGPVTAQPGRSASRWYKLDHAAAAFDVPPGGHRALADAEVCRRVVVGMAATL
jgi:DNA polymerase-3 subunit epsilon